MVKVINTFILRAKIVKTPKEEIGLVVAGWSQAMRKDWQENDNWRNRRVEQDGDLINHIRKTMRHMISFQTLCERYNLPYMHFQMGTMFESMYKGEISKSGTPIKKVDKRQCSTI